MIIWFDNWHIVERSGIKTLLNGTDFVMDDCKLHIDIIDKHVQEMSGHVLLTGLGMGCFLDAALQNPNITQITCLEFEQRLIDFHKDKYPTVSFVCDDAWKWKPNMEFDYIWHDIFSEINPTSIAQFEFIKRKYAPYCTGKISGLFDGYFDHDERLRSIQLEVLSKRESG